MPATQTRLIIVVVQHVVVHLAAFLIRMFKGEFKNEPERIISETLRGYVARFTQNHTQKASPA